MFIPVPPCPRAPRVWYRLSKQLPLDQLVHERLLSEAAGKGGADAERELAAWAQKAKGYLPMGMFDEFGVAQTHFATPIGPLAGIRIRFLRTLSNWVIFNEVSHSTRIFLLHFSHSNIFCSIFHSNIFCSHSNIRALEYSFEYSHSITKFS